MKLIAKMMYNLECLKKLFSIMGRRFIIIVLIVIKREGVYHIFEGCATINVGEMFFCLNF